MKVASIRKEVLIGLSVATAHAAYVGWCVRVAFDALISGSTDLDLFFYHQFSFAWLDAPVTVLQVYGLPPFGMFPNGSILSYAFEDTVFLVMGTLLWFVQGYFLARLHTRGTLSGGLTYLKRRGWWSWRLVRTVALITLLYLFLRQVALEQLHMWTLLYWLKGAEVLVPITLPTLMTAMAITLEVRNYYRHKKQSCAPSGL